MTKINLVRKEEKTLKFTVTDSNGTAVSLLNATLKLYIKANKGAVAVVTKNDADFDKTLASTGIVKLNLTSSDLDRSGYFYALFETVLNATHTDRFYFVIDIAEAV